MFAPDEAINGQVVIKNLATGEQNSHPTGSVVDAVLSALSSPVQP